MKVYVASGGKAVAQLVAAKDLMQRLRDAGHTITFDWTDAKPMWIQDMETKVNAGMLADEEVTAVLAADVLVVLLPGGRGAHVELGIALGAGKLVYLVSANDQHHELCPEASIFYFHPHVVRFRTEDEVLEHLQV